MRLRPLSGGPVGANPKQLSVRVVKAAQLMPSSDSSSHRHRGLELVAPYVVVEVDEPGQKFVTRPGVVCPIKRGPSAGGANVEWDQDFVL